MNSSNERKKSEEDKDSSGSKSKRSSNIDFHTFGDANSDESGSMIEKMENSQ